MLKKAVSPIIAVIILIMFTVGLGAVVVTITSSTTNDFVEAATNNIDQGIQCTMDLDLGVLYANGNYIACYNRSSSHNLEFIIENRGSSQVDGIRVIAVGSDESLSTAAAKQTIEPHSTSRFNLSLGTGFSYPILELVFTPIVRNDILCANNEFSITSIDQC